MDQPIASSSSDDDRSRLRRLLPGRGPDRDNLSDAAPGVEQLIESYRATAERQLEEGLQRIQLTASSLMHEIAGEVWRTAGGSKEEARSQILQDVVRDQAIRGLIAHSDERFQALAVRTASLEDTLNAVAESIRQTKDQLSGLVESRSPGRDDELRTSLVEVTRQVAAALGSLAERDEAIVEAVRARVREHGELLTQETTRISGAMESYVQHGVRAIGELAGTVEAQVQTIAGREALVAEVVREAIEEHMRLLGEQLQLLYDRMMVGTSSVVEEIARRADRGDRRVREVAEYLQLLNDRVDVAMRDVVAETRRTLDARVLGLARLVRSDSEALRREFAGTVEAERTGLVQLIEETVDQRVARLARLIRSDNQTLAVQIAADQEASKLALRATKELQASLPGEVIEMVEQRFASLAESIERSNEMLAKRIDRMGDRVGERADNDIQVVIDRMGDAMHALASLGRPGPARAE